MKLPRLAPGGFHTEAGTPVLTAVRPAEKPIPNGWRFAAMLAMLTALTCAIPRPAYAQCVPQPYELVAWWRAQNDFRDTMGTHHGSLPGSATFNPGKVGQSFEFNGEDQYVVIPDADELTPRGSFTIEAWVFPATDQDSAIFAKWGHAGDYANQRSYVFGLYPGYKLQFGISDADKQLDEAFHRFLSDDTINLGEWNHVAGVYDQETGTRRIYVNGDKVAERTDDPITVLDGIANASIGAALGSSTSARLLFDGLIDELSFYHRALTEDELKAIYEAGEHGKCFVARWPVNGHFYEFVPGTFTWNEAKTAAASRSYSEPGLGTVLPGHLATITSAGENAFILEQFGTATANRFAWLAGREPADDGAWKWEAGPEAGNIFDVTTDGDAEEYANWGGDQPDDAATDEDFLKFNIGAAFDGVASGQWADASATSSTADPVAGYIVEYSWLHECPLEPKARISEVELSWASVADASYTVEYAPDLSFTTGVITSGPHTGTGGFIKVQVAIPALSSVKFFRVIVDDGSTSPTLSLRPSEVELYWPSLPGKIYQVQFSDSATDWTDEGTPITATDWTTTARFDIVTGVTRKSYRVTCP